MLPRTSLGRNAARAIRHHASCKQTVTKRGMAAAAGPKGYEYETSEAAGIKVANRDVAGSTTTLTVVAKAGSRYQPFPGYSEVLEKFAFKSTLKRSALRITRENELLGGELSSYHSKENLVLSARFLSADLPYYAELLSEVISNSKYSRHELDELVMGLVKYSQDGLLTDASSQALESAHSLAFHHGLGNPSTLSPSVVKKYATAEGITAFAQGAYIKPSVSVVSSGASTSDLTKWVGQFFADVPATAATGEFAPLPTQASKYFGGEERISSQTGNAMVIAFPGSSSFGTSGYKPELAVLASLLGGESNIKWSSGSSILAKAVESVPGTQVSTNQATYSDAGLFYITISGKTAGGVAQASKNVVEGLKKVASGNVAAEEIKKAKALAKFRALETGQNTSTGMEATGSALIHGGRPLLTSELGQGFDKVTETQVKAAAKSLFSNKASVSSVGDLFSLPYATDLGLTV